MKAAQQNQHAKTSSWAAFVQPVALLLLILYGCGAYYVFIHDGEIDLDTLWSGAGLGQDSSIHKASASASNIGAAATGETAPSATASAPSSEAAKAAAAAKARATELSQLEDAAEVSKGASFHTRNALGMNGKHGPVPGTAKVRTWEHGTIHWPELQAWDPENPEGTGANNMPRMLNLLDRLTEWNPDQPEIPTVHTETIQHFDYNNPLERILAREYRDAEVPFKLYNVPEFENTRNLWTDEYLSTAASNNNHVVEHSKDNHFMYWAKKSWKKESTGFIAPTDYVTGTVKFRDWLAIAKKADEDKIDQSKNMNTEHYYFMTNAMKGDKSRTFIARDLQMFSNGKKNFFIKYPERNKGTQCRMGTRGIISEAHYDCGRNMILMLRGAKRYILTPPQSCDQVELIPDPDHPSYRHSQVDWSNITDAKKHNFDKVDAIDTIVRAGEVLYVPSYWMHYIISLSMSIQCNSRFGPNESLEAYEPIKQCFERDMKKNPWNESSKESHGGKHKHHKKGFSLGF